MVDYNQQIKNKPIVNDTSFNSLTALCNAGSGVIINLLKNWTISTSKTCPINIQYSGGHFVISTSALLTLTGKQFFTSLTQQAFDISGANIATNLTGVGFGVGAVSTITPNLFGATGLGGTIGSGGHDDWPATQAALNACAPAATSYNATCRVILPAGTYPMSKEVAMFANYDGGYAGGYNGLSFCGDSLFTSIIAYQGISSTSAVHMIGYYQTLCNMRIINYGNSGWLDGVNYDGNSGIGISTHGRLDNLLIDVNGLAGNGISYGRGAFQADQSANINVTVVSAFSGICFNVLDSNSLSNVLYGGGCGTSWIGLKTVNSLNFSIYGGEFDNNDVNFFPGAGTSIRVDGVRSEGSERSFWSSTGEFPQSITFINYHVATNHTARPTTTTTASAGATTITLAFTNTSNAYSYTLGDTLSIAGAGTASAALSTKIVAMTSPTSATISSAIVTSVTSAAVTLDSGVYQNNFEENASGPYIHEGVQIDTTTGGYFTKSNGTQIFDGVIWRENITNPFNLASSASCQTFGRQNIAWRGLYSNNAGTHFVMQDWAAQTAQAVPSNPNVYDVDDSGSMSANNAIVTSQPAGLWCTPYLYDGLTVQVQLKTYTLQAGGPNTINFAGTGVNPILSHYNPANYGATAYHAAGKLIITWRAAYGWMDSSQ